jgi:hypothetical protein
MLVAREKQAASPALQHTSNWPPRSTCQPAGHTPPLHVAGPPCEEMIAEHATVVTCVGFDPISENMPEQHATQNPVGLLAQLAHPPSGSSTVSSGRKPPGPQGKSHAIGDPLALLCAGGTQWVVFSREQHVLGSGKVSHRPQGRKGASEFSTHSGD